MFCRTEAFREIGGFSLNLFAAEEVVFSEALKRWARSRRQQVIILRRQAHVSSGRKFRLYSRKKLLWDVLRNLLHPGQALRERKRLDFFYDGRR